MFFLVCVYPIIHPNLPIAQYMCPWVQPLEEYYGIGLGEVDGGLRYRQGFRVEGGVLVYREVLVLTTSIL